MSTITLHQTQNPSLTGKMHPHHLDRLAMVYVRQSTLQQVTGNQESTKLQYNLAQRAQALGWSPDRVRVIDDDLGKSGANAQGRPGFQRLVGEVGLNHVGIILGVDMSRLARSCKDWHQLLEICSLFQTLIADLDGVYDPCQYNDRLLLGLKGTMSEAELHLITQRLQQGKLNKARRGELRQLLPTGYVRLPNGDTALDPDEQVQHVIRLLFHLFDELGTVNGVLRYGAAHDIRLGVRVGPPGQAHPSTLTWRPLTRTALYSLLRHPLYAGMYTYGRHQTDPRKKQPGRPKSGRAVVEQQRWYVCLPDRVPAYISPRQYERNQARMRANQSRAACMGAPREGNALLTGLLVCARCGCRMSVRYGKGLYTYVCMAQRLHAGGACCQQTAGSVLDAFVTRQVLAVLQPASLELSLQATTDALAERDRLHRLWQHKLERAEYEAGRAGRHYRAVEPENRLVARQLARDWEEKLGVQRGLREEYDRFCHRHPPELSEPECEGLRRLASDIPALWSSPHTTPAQRKRLIRELIHRVSVAVENDSERVKLTVSWVGGHQSQNTVTRPVGKVSQLSNYQELCAQARAWADEGMSARSMARRLTEAGWCRARPRAGRAGFTAGMVSSLLRRLGVRGKALSRDDATMRASEERVSWSLSALSECLGMPRSTLYAWVKRGWVDGKLEQGHWRIEADQTEQERLRLLHRQSLSEKMRHSWLTRTLPKPPVASPTNEKPEARK